MSQKTSYKCTLLGDFGLSSFLLSSHSASLGAGKSSLLLRIAYDKFGREFEPTIGVEFGLKKFNVNGNDIKLQIWDTVRNHPFESGLMMSLEWRTAIYRLSPNWVPRCSRAFLGLCGHRVRELNVGEWDCSIWLAEKHLWAYRDG